MAKSECHKCGFAKFGDDVMGSTTYERRSRPLLRYKTCQILSKHVQRFFNIFNNPAVPN